MHGILFKQLKTYVTEQWGDDAWEQAMMEEAGIEPKLYLPVTEYPDEEALRLIDGVVAVTGVERATLLADLGEYLAPALLDTFKAHIKSDWDAMDLLEHSGNQVFAVLRSENGGEDEVVASRENGNTVLLEYGVSLQMCELAKGVLKGIAEEHGESVTVEERQCMHTGASRCEIKVSRT